MALYQPLWMQDGNYSAQLDRQVMDAFVPGNQSVVVNVTDLQALQRAAGANMSVDVQPGRALIYGTSIFMQGQYMCWSDAVFNVPIAAAPPSGQSRYDLIVAQVRDSNVVGGAYDDWIITAVTGVPATTGNQAVPAAPASSMILAYVTVGPLVTSIVNANILDRRLYLTTDSRPVPVAASSGRISYTDATGQIFVAQGGVVGGAYRKAHDVLYARTYYNGGSNTVAGDHVFAFDTIDYDTYGLFLSKYSFVTPLAGIYLLNTQINVLATAVNQWISVRFAQLVGATWVTLAAGGTNAVAVGNQMVVPVTAVRKIPASTQITVYLNPSVSGLNILQGSSGCFFEAAYMGPG